MKFTAIIIWTFIGVGLLTIANPWLGGTGSDKTAGTSYTITITQAASNNPQAGSLFIVGIASDNLGATTDGDKGDITSVTDNAGNTYTKAIEFSNVQTGAGNGATASIWYCKLTNNITANTTTLTVNFSGSVTAKAIGFIDFTIASGNSVAVQSTSGLANDGADAGSITLSSLPSQQYVFIRVTAIENAPSGSATVSTNFASVINSSTMQGTSTGGAASNMSLMLEWRITTTTSQATDPATTYTSDCASAMAAFYEFTPAALPHRIRIIGKP